MVFTVIFMVFIAILVIIYWYATIPQKLPPGPIGLPFLGYFVVWDRMHKKFLNIGKKYGGIWCFYRFNKLVVVINDLEIMKQAIGRQGECFTLKLDNGTPYRTLHLKEGLLYVDGDRWQEQRRFAILTLRKLGLGRSIIQSTIIDECHQMVNSLDSYSVSAGKPIDPEPFFQNAVANISCRIIFGKRYAYDNTQFVRMVNLVSVATRQANLGILIGLKDWFRLLPGAKQTWATVVERQEELHKLFQYFIEDSEKNVDGEEEIESYVRAFRKEQAAGNGTFFNDHQLLCAVRDLFCASLETTSTTIYWAILLCTCHPQVQKRCQEELDNICSDGDPKYEDRSKTPYLEATIMEVLRFSSVLAFLSRGTSKAVQVGPYQIPAGAAVFVNSYAVHSNEKYFPNPNEFRPERFLDKENRINGEKSDILLSFGLGKRVCLGEGLARMELYLLFAMLLRHFTFSFEKGTSMPTCLESNAAITLHPCQYEVIIQRRDGTENHSVS